MTLRFGTHAEMEGPAHAGLPGGMGIGVSSRVQSGCSAASAADLTPCDQVRDERPQGLRHTVAIAAPARRRSAERAGPQTVKAARRPPRPRRAFWLVEFVALLAVLGIFALVATQVIGFALRTSAVAGDSRESAARIDLLVNRLRADVWNARKIEADGPTAKIIDADGSQVVWRAAPDGSVVRLAGPADAAPDRLRLDPIRPGGPAVRFAATGGGLRVELPTDAAGGADRVTLVSQLLAQGGKP